MNLGNSEKAATYMDFFMKPNSGRRRLNLTQTSTLDEVILGRDFDGSGSDPHVEFMKQFDEHAGVKSGNEGARRKKAGCSMASVMDDTIWGRDFDQSGANPEEMFDKMYGTNLAGIRSGATEKATTLRPGYAMGSVMDSVIWGRDFDQSGEDPQLVWDQKFGGHAGGKTAPSEKDHRPLKKHLVGQGTMSIISDLVRGQEPESIPDPLHDLYDGLAGIRQGGEKERKPFRRPGFSNTSTFDHTKWGTEHSAVAVHQQHFAGNYQDHAGVKTVRESKSMRNARERAERATQLEQAKEAALAEQPEPPRVRSSSTPVASSRRSSSRRRSSGASSSSKAALAAARAAAAAANRISASDAAAQQPASLDDQIVRPSSRRSSVASSCQPAPALMSARARSTGSRASSSGSLTSRDYGAHYQMKQETGSCGSAPKMEKLVCTPPEPQYKPPSRNSRASSVGSLTSRDYGAHYAKAEALAPVTPRKRASVISADSTVSGSKRSSAADNISICGKDNAPKAPSVCSSVA